MMHRYIDENDPVFRRPDATHRQWEFLLAHVATQPDADTLRDMLMPERREWAQITRGRALPAHGWSAR